MTSKAAEAAKGHLALRLLNNASSKTGGTWEVYIYRSFEDKYSYSWQGKPREGSNFICTLVDAEDPSQYCQAQFKKTSGNTQKYQQAIKECKDGAHFIMSRVGFVDDAKLAYVSCPLKTVVDLAKTKMDACIGTSSSAVQPAPMTTIAGSINLRNSQFFDITALIQEMDETRNHDNNRSSFAVKIYDGSLDDSTNKNQNSAIDGVF
jgi:hypothetical protein